MVTNREQQGYLDINVRNEQYVSEIVTRLTNVSNAFNALANSAVEHVGDFVIAVDSALKKMEVIGTNVTPEEFTKRFIELTVGKDGTE